MEKLPTHTGETQDAPKDPKHAATRPKQDQAVFLRRLLIVFCFLAGYVWLLRTRPTLCMFGTCKTSGCGTPESISYESSPLSDGEDQAQNEALGQAVLGQLPLSGGAKKIPFEAHIMSKCPDAQGCLQKLVLPAMEQISDKVDFQLSFIADVSRETSDIQCMHGPGECIGNMLMLCAANLPFPPTEDTSLLPNTYPRTPIIRSLGFANCLISDYPRIPEREFVIQCALEHGIDFEALNTCASQQSDNPHDTPDDGFFTAPLSGIALLRENALRSERLDVHTSCTVRVDDAVWCVHDSGDWKECAQDGAGSKPHVLIDEINRLWDARN